MLACLPVALMAQAGPRLPSPRGMVNDFAGVIPPERAAGIERLARYVRERSGGEIVVVTLDDLAGRDPAEVALRIGREWKVGAATQVGDARRNTGIVILVVPKETSRDGQGHVRIETGQGTEGFLTDGQAGDIQREAIPFLRARDYGGAIALMTVRVAQRYAANFAFSLDSVEAAPREPAARRGGDRGGTSIVPVAFALFLVLLFLLGGRSRGSGCLWLALASQGRGQRGWPVGGGGGFGGGGGGFGGFGGGGGFSGGGSSGSW